MASGTHGWWYTWLVVHMAGLQGGRPAGCKGIRFGRGLFQRRRGAARAVSARCRPEVPTSCGRNDSGRGLDTGHTILTEKK
eukprot:gene24856-biopygen14980